MEKLKESTKIKCKKCGYQWMTASDKDYVCCPNCLRKIPNLKKGGKIK